MTDETVYVYGVLGAGRLPRGMPAGVTGAEVREVRDDELAALVSSFTGGAAASARELRAHWAVLDAVSKETTVLPIRFGTVIESEQAVRERVLAPDAEQLGSLLRELDGRVQLTLKGEYDQEHLLREVVRSTPSVAALRERVRLLPAEAGYYERIRLGEAVAAEVERRRVEDSDRVLARLAPLAVASRSEAPTGTEGAFNLAFLVERERVEEFGGAVAELGKELGASVRMRFVGPLPPYSFADLDQAGAATAESRNPAWA